MGFVVEFCVGAGGKDVVDLQGVALMQFADAVEFDAQVAVWKVRQFAFVEVAFLDEFADEVDGDVLVGVFEGVEFLEIVASAVFVNELFISVFTSYRNIHKEQHQKPKIKYQHQPKPNPPHIKIQPHLLIRRRIPINPQRNPLNGKHHSKHPQQHKLHDQPIDIPPLLREGPGQTEPDNLAYLQHGQHHHLKIAVGVEDGEGEHHEDLLYVAEDVVVVGLEVVF